MLPLIRKGYNIMTAKITSMACLAVFLTCGAGFGADLKIGMVDIRKVLDTSMAGKATLAELKSSGEKMESEIQQKWSDIQELKKNLERKAMVMNPETREQTERDLNIKVTDVKFLEQKYSDDFKRQELQLVSHIKDEVLSIIDEIGKREGYTLILERKETGVLFAPTAMDLTDQVVREYDAKQPAQGSKPAAKQDAKPAKQEKAK
jgi:outer membrane protein